jgi:hypothetical protein
MSCKESEDKSETQQLALHQMQDSPSPLLSALSTLRGRYTESVGIDLEGSIIHSGTQLKELLITAGEHAELRLLKFTEMTGFIVCHVCLYALSCVS